MAHTKQELMIEFVPSKGIVTKKHSNKHKSKKETVCGTEIRDFYEDVLSGTPSSGTAEATGSTDEHKTLSDKIDIVFRGVGPSTLTKTNDQNFSSNDKEKKKVELKLLQSCQDGNVYHVSKCLTKDIDINVQDQYGWTPLMCAAYAGHNEVVKLLIETGADWTICEKRQRTARDLAGITGHQDTAKLMDDLVNKEDSNRYDSQHPDGFYCDVCKSQFQEGSLKAHSASTVHLFNRQLKPQQPGYFITEGNVGYQMMLKSGWNSSEGLGPSGEGQKFPVKTVLKRDRKGLGKETKTNPKVTHFKAGDAKAVKTVKPRDERTESVRTLSRKAMRRKERRDKEWEQRLRRYMNSD